MASVDVRASLMFMVNPRRHVRMNKMPMRWTTSSVSYVEMRSRRSVQIRQEGLLSGSKGKVRYIKVNAKICNWKGFGLEATVEALMAIIPT
jgi:hypothetical protein